MIRRICLRRWSSRRTEYKRVDAKNGGFPLLINVDIFSDEWFFTRTVCHDAGLIRHGKSDVAFRVERNVVRIVRAYTIRSQTKPSQQKRRGIFTYSPDDFENRWHDDMYSMRAYQKLVWRFYFNRGATNGSGKTPDQLFINTNTNDRP